MTPNKLDFWGSTIIIFLLLLLSYAGYLAYKSIDWTVLKRLESQTLVLPTQVMTASPSASTATPSTKR